MSKTPNQITLRLPEGIRAKVKQLAEQNRRSLNSEIVSLVERAMKFAHSADTPSNQPQS
jgi:hypothetical protein